MGGGRQEHLVMSESKEAPIKTKGSGHIKGTQEPT